LVTKNDNSKSVHKLAIFHAALPIGRLTLPHHKVFEELLVRMGATTSSLGHLKQISSPRQSQREWNPIFPNISNWVQRWQRYGLAYKVKCSDLQPLPICSNPYIADGVIFPNNQAIWRIIVWSSFLPFDLFRWLLRSLGKEGRHGIL